MRVTNNILTRGYLRTMNNNISNLAKSNNKLSSQRKFMDASENVADASRALQVREQLDANERALNNIRDAKGKLSTAEDNMRSINTLLQTVNERTIQGMNGAMAEDEKAKIAREIQNLQQQILQIGNAQYSDKYLFNSAGGAVKGAPPFTIDPAGGALIYNGTQVSTISKNAAGDLVLPDGTKVPYNGANYLDIGLGFTVKGQGINSQLETNTAMKSTISGLDVLGYGMTGTVPNNLYDLLGKIAKDFTTTPIDLGELGNDLGVLKNQTNSLLNTITDVGNTYNFMEQTEVRLENDKLNLQTVQNSLEAVSVQEEAIYNKNHEMSWMVTLQLGAKILPTSIFDFLR